MNNGTTDIQEKMRALQEAYLVSLAERRGDILAALDGLKPGKGDEGDEGAVAALESLRHHAHKTAGSGATFGFADISDTAKKLELACDAHLESGPPYGGELFDQLSALSGPLLDAIDAAAKGAGEPAAASAPSVPSAPPIGGADDEAARIILIVGTETPEKEELITGVANFGFKIDGANSLDEARVHWSGVRSRKKGDGLAAVVVNQSPGVVPADEDLSETFGCPVIFLLENDRLEDRLAAVRAGAETCFLRPVRIVELVDALDRLTLSNESEPYRVLVIDDDQSVLQYNAAVLKGAGMIAHALTDPAKILEILDDFSPEIILMDLYMPECDGQELASVIRQKEEFAGIPIVFLSSETDVHKQVSAMSHGGDGFLTKPISPTHLVNYVLVRAKRFRMLRNLMVRDSLTGLYNHTTTKQFLDNEIARAERDKTPVSFAMVDIDHFKSVNDTYGHGVGDQVIKSLSRLLKQRLRTTDIVGRMGGEEFGVVLPGASGAVAQRILDGIRTAFSEIDQPGDDKAFHTTFSCGVAECPEGGAGQAVSEAADKALYVAKEGGRNRVVLSED